LNKVETCMVVSFAISRRTGSSNMSASTVAAYVSENLIVSISNKQLPLKVKK